MLVEAGKLSPVDEAHAACGSALYIKNITKLNSLFLGGFVILEETPDEVCAENCPVTLFQNGAAIQTQQTNAFGEFKFDSLKPGTYQLRVSPERGQSKMVEMELTESTSVSIRL